MQRLILQHLWSRWTKASRTPQRPRLATAYPLPALPAAAAVLHEVRLLEAEDFELRTRTLELTIDTWARSEPLHAANLTWTASQTGYEISLHEPWSSVRRTPWPAHLPRPLLTLAPGDVALIDWNGRFMNSAGGSNRGYFYEEHRFWLAHAEGPDPGLFLTATPRKHIDLRTRIH